MAISDARGFEHRPQYSPRIVGAEIQELTDVAGFRGRKDRHVLDSDRRDRGVDVLSRAAAISRQTLQRYRAAENLPRLESAKRLAEVLEDDGLVDFVLRSRTRICPVDHVSFVHDGQGNRLC